MGVCEVLRRDAYITSTHRGHSHYLAKGASVHLMYADLNRPTGCVKNLVVDYLALAWYEALYACALCRVLAK